MRWYMKNISRMVSINYRKDTYTYYEYKMVEDIPMRGE